MDCSHATNSLLSIELKIEVRQEATMNKDDHQDCHDQKKKKRSGAASSTNNTGCASRTCQVDKCTEDLGDAKQYYRRHRVCEHHSKAQVVMVGGLHQRFCQQCSRFHELFEFDEAKRSCRRRLAGHNERRRKSTTTDTQSEGTSSTHKGT